MFIFRNFTIENLFSPETAFSGYGDISLLPEDDSYCWFYLVPVEPTLKNVADEVRVFRDKLNLIVNQVPRSKPLYIITLTELVSYRICDTERDLQNAIDEFNCFIRTLASERPNIRILDLKEFLDSYSDSQWVNWKYYFLSQMIINPTLAQSFKIWWANRMSEFNNPRKKCLILDLDNTLWSGVLGEDGINGVKMSGDYPGNTFMYFQEGLIRLADSGVILTVCSKNNESDVKELWEKNPFVKLGPDKISAYRINWNNKADNIKELAKELNIGLDSMVFVDDNPTEREWVKNQLPMVEVPDFPKRPCDLMTFYSEIVERYFRTYSLTSEDREKTAQYKANAQRKAAEASFTNMEDFIKSLEIKIEIQPANEFNIERIAQMTQKTNQFNLTTYRYTVTDIQNFISKGDLVYCMSVSDKFGDNGITGAMIIELDGNKAVIDTLLLSCRILGKGIENILLDAVLNKLYEDGIKNVTAYFLATPKNSLVKDFYDKRGFILISETPKKKKYNIILDSKRELSRNYMISY